MTAPGRVGSVAQWLSAAAGVFEELEDLAISRVDIGGAQSGPRYGDHRGHVLLVADPEDLHTEQVA